MADPRVEKLAKVLVHYALELQPGQQFWLRTTPLAEELNLVVYEEAVRAGVHVFVDQRMPGADEIFYKYASDEQLDLAVRAGGAVMEAVIGMDVKVHKRHGSVLQARSVEQAVD